jgi:hypothetical protein
MNNNNTNVSNMKTMKSQPTAGMHKKNLMSTTTGLSARLGLALCSALFGCATYGQPSVSVGVSVPLPSVEIHATSDFYEPLTAYGRWEVVGSYGRCWIPARVEADWRPYSEGYWQRTEAGWYWTSEEPWAWATYHYGRWDLSAQLGWYWVPQTQWAPAWVSWHSGGGYVGWAPLLPAVSISAGGFVGFNAALVSPRAYVFVEQRHFLEPVRRSTVVVNNTTIINKTVIITNTKLVNQTVINEGPPTAAIEKASGRKVQPVPVQEVRHKGEAAVVAKQRTPAAAVLPAKAVQPEAKPEGNHPPVVKAPAGPKTDPRAPMAEKPVKPSDKKEQPAAKAKPAPSGKGGPGTGDKGHEKKGKE